MSIDREIEALQIAWKAGHEQGVAFFRLNPGVVTLPCGACHRLERFKWDGQTWRCTGIVYIEGQREGQSCGASVRNDGMELAFALVEKWIEQGHVPRPATQKPVEGHTKSTGFHDTRRGWLDHSQGRD